MKTLAILFLSISMILVSISCSKSSESSLISSSGTIQKQGIITYQYGTHILKNNNGQVIYALKSDNINLDNYFNKVVDIQGSKIKGYPIEGGPEYIIVSKIN